jgi:hypothetical protein
VSSKSEFVDSSSQTSNERLLVVFVIIDIPNIIMVYIQPTCQDTLRGTNGGKKGFLQQVPIESARGRRRSSTRFFFCCCSSHEKEIRHHKVMAI